MVDFRYGSQIALITVQVVKLYTIKIFTLNLRLTIHRTCG
jgi:hypothetical protein